MNPGCDTMRADKVGGREDGCEGPEPANALEKISMPVTSLQGGLLTQLCFLRRCFRPTMSSPRREVRLFELTRTQKKREVAAEACEISAFACLLVMIRLGQNLRRY